MRGGIFLSQTPKTHPQSWMRRYFTITLFTPHTPSKCRTSRKKKRLAAITHTHRHTNTPTYTHTHPHWLHSTENTEQWGQFHLWFFKEFGWYWFGAKVSSSFRQSGAFRSSRKELRPQPETEAETLSWNTRQQSSVGANNVSKHTIPITAQTKTNKHTNTHMHTYMHPRPLSLPRSPMSTLHWMQSGKEAKGVWERRGGVLHAFVVKRRRIRGVFERVIEAHQFISRPRPRDFWGGGGGGGLLALFTVGCATFILTVGVFVSGFKSLQN